MKRNLTTKCKKLIKKTKVVPSQIVHEAETGYRARGAKCNIHSQKPGSHQINEGEDKVGKGFEVPASEVSRVKNTGYQKLNSKGARART